MVSDNLLRGIAAGGNPVAQSYNQKSQQLRQERVQDAEAQRADQRFQMETERFDMEKSRQNDSDMLRVFELAGDGFVNEAAYFAKTKGLQVPQEVFSNGEMAKGLSLSGKMYPGEPEKAKRFTMAWMSAPDGTDFMQRIDMAIQAGGQPTNADERALSRAIALEKWKLDNRIGDTSKGFSLSPGQIRYDSMGRVIAQAPGNEDIDKGAQEIYRKTYSDIMSNIARNATPDEAHAVAEQAAQNYQRTFGSFYGQQPNLGAQPPVAAAPAPQAPLQQAAPSAAIQGASEQPPVPGARKAPDGNWYVPDPNNPGKYLLVR